MNTLIFGLVGIFSASVLVVGGVQGYKAATVDTDSVPRIVNGSQVTYGDD